MHTILSLCAEVLNVEEIADAYLRAHNKEMPAAPPILGKAFLWALPHSMKAPYVWPLSFVPDTRSKAFPATCLLTMFYSSMRQMVRNHEARVNGEFPTWDAEVEKARAVVKMQTFYEFQLERRAQGQGRGTRRWCALFDAVKWSGISKAKPATRSAQPAGISTLVSADIEAR